MSYSPVLGRFIQRDPLGYVDGGSLYEYVRSGPVSFTDASGLAVTFSSGLFIGRWWSREPSPPTPVQEAMHARMVEDLKELWDMLNAPPSFPAHDKWRAIQKDPCASEWEKLLAAFLAMIEIYGPPVGGMQGPVQGIKPPINVPAPKGVPGDLGGTLDRIAKGARFPHRNDGTPFQNREGLLPPKPADYYKEYVHPTPGLSGPGGQRVIVGQGGEVYYTPDHYKTFVPVK